jgi:hydroxymethylpyrimidine/phosphomethylpyrimidine kinase
VARAAAQALACSIGSIDPTCAAGSSVDLAVFRAYSVAGACVTVAVTAQNARHVTDVQSLGARSVRRQLEAIWEQAQPRAVCIGLVPDIDAMRTIRAFFARRHREAAVVVDPVIASSSGYAFYGAREITELQKLLSIATLVTPNVAEASILSSRKIESAAAAIAAAMRIGETGCAVLVTGHLSGARCVDILVAGGRVRRYSATRLRGALRGSGGILAAAITAGLARGLALEASIARARAFVRRAFGDARRIGSGLPQYLG